uniref:Ydr279p protein family (RNase H2 complex component), putative n=1 Tax=Theileria annulata TaxID=5874 RepID=A0A3B0N9D4_THEAN
MLLSSSILKFNNSSNKPSKEFEFNTKSQLLISHNSLSNEKAYEIVFLPSPTNPLEPDYFVFSNNKFYRLQGIKPNVNRVSVFVDHILTSLDLIAATFDFDVLFIFISILYQNKNNYLTMASRIIEFYSGKSADYTLSNLQSSVMYLWQNNVNKVKDRIKYLCDVMESQGVNELLLKPNDMKFTHLLKFKVNNMVKYVVDNNIAISSYSNVETTKSEDLRKNLVTIDEGKCRRFCWSIVKSLLSPESSRHIIPSDILNSISKPIIVEKNPQIITTRSKRHKINHVPKGTSSITSFFKPK